MTVTTRRSSQIGAGGQGMGGTEPGAEPPQPHPGPEEVEQEAGDSGTPNPPVPRESPLAESTGQTRGQLDEAPPLDSDTENRSRTGSEGSGLLPEDIANLQDLVILTDRHCRVEFKASVAREGKRVPAVCGMLVSECDRRHASQRLAGNRKPSGGYTKLLGNRFPGHGMAQGLYLTPQEVAQARDREHQRRQTQRHQEMGQYESEEEIETATDPDVMGPRPFRGLFPQTGTPRSPQQGEGRRGSASGEAGNPWMGLVNDQGCRVLARDVDGLSAWTSLGYHHTRTFQNYRAALDWVGSQSTESPGEQSATGPQEEGDRDQSEEDSSVPRRSERRPPRDRPRDRSPLRASRRHRKGHPSDSEPSDSSSDSSSSESYREERKRHTKKKRGQRRGRSSRHKAGRRRRSRSSDSDSQSSQDSEGPPLPRGKSLLGGDKSTTEEEAFGMDIGSDKLLASLGPKDMTRHMGKKLFDYPADLLTLPGVMSSSEDMKAEYHEDQVINQVSAILRTYPERKDQPHDTNWRASSHHALGKVSSYQGLMKHIEGYQKTVTRALKFEQSRLKQWMRREGYQLKEIEDFQRQGGLPLLLRDLQQYYFALLMKLQSEANKCAPAWSGTYAQSLLKHHKTELGYIRSMAGSRGDLLLSNYVYLRNAYKSKFTSLELQDNVLRDRLLDLGGISPDNPPSGDKGEGAKRKACRCQNPKVHRLLGIKYYDVTPETCPVAASSSAARARKAAKALLLKVEEYEGTPSSSLWRGWASKAVETAET